MDIVIDLMCVDTDVPGKAKSISLDGVKLVDDTDFYISLKKVGRRESSIDVELYNDEVGDTTSLRCGETCPWAILAGVAIHSTVIKEIIFDASPEDVGDILLTTIAAHFARFEVVARNGVIRINVSINGFETFAEAPAEQLAGYLTCDEVLK